MMRRSFTAATLGVSGSFLAKPLRQRRLTATKPPGGAGEGSASDEATRAAHEASAKQQGDASPAASGDGAEKAQQGSSADLEATAAKGDSEVEETIETQRWVQAEPDHRIVDEKGEYIVSKTKWHTGEVAYQTPAPPNHLQARFGYNVVQVKKPQTYWQFYRWNPHVSFRHLNVLVIFAVGLTLLGSFLMAEIQHMQYETMKPGQMAGEVRGKGAPNGKNMKITTSLAEQDEFMQKLQKGYLNADELAYMGNKEYQMKKIPRPKEFRVQDYLRG